MSWTSTFFIRRRSRAAALCALLASGPLTGCADVRGRKLIQEGNDQYKSGHFQEAVATYVEAEALVPGLPTLWLNKGYTCRQLIAPGAKDAESRQAVTCALEAFKRLAELKPGDARADQLMVETMFDADDLQGLETLFLERNRRAPDDVGVVRGLQQVYYKWGKWPQALQWSKRAAALRGADAEAQYGVGTFIWQVLSARGGGSEMVAYDPRPRLPPPDEDAAVADKDEIATGGRNVKRKVTPPVPVAIPVSPPPPPTAANDIVGPLRAELADDGIRYLEKAVALRPRYAEAMTYLSLLYRQKSFAYFADVPRWQAAVDRSNDWQKRANDTRAGKS
jgi:tetratricopeptide (TPR) repeat protein